MSMGEQGEADPAVLARAQGSLLGQLAGDALGSMVEFQDAASIRRAHPQGLRLIGPSPIWHTLAGQPTDDSELALALARTLAVGGPFSEVSVANAYADWLESSPFDVGNTTRMALQAVAEARRRGQNPAVAGRAAAFGGSEANGALMRQSPLAIWGSALSPEELDRHVRADTTLTHPSRVCQDASAAFAVALAAVVREGLDGQQAHQRACEWDRSHGASHTVSVALADARTAAPHFKPSEGHVLIALQNAFYQAIHAPSFEEGVVATVMGGGDSDTNGAIAGALLGALHGAYAVPPQWREAVLSCRPAIGAPGVRQPRPEIYWPVDALILAESLVIAGRAARQGQRSGPRNPVDGTDPMTRSRFRGALLGGAIGDALCRLADGSRQPHFGPPWPVTGYPAGRGYQGEPKGRITDHTGLTICLAESLIANGYLDNEDFAQRLVAWLPHAQGAGGIPRAAASRLALGAPWYLAGEDSAGSEAAVRAAPIGLLRWQQPEMLRHEAILSALPTHRQPTAVAGAVAMAAAVGWLVSARPSDWSPPEFVRAVQRSIDGLEREPHPPRASDALPTLHSRIADIPESLRQPPDRVFARRHNGTPVLEGLPAALYCFLQTPDDPEQVLLLATNAGYGPDMGMGMDTVAAMAGTLAGAANGESSLPARLLAELEYRQELTALADRLFDRASRP